MVGRFLFEKSSGKLWTTHTRPAYASACSSRASRVAASRRRWWRWRRGSPARGHAVTLLPCRSEGRLAGALPLRAPGAAQAGAAVGAGRAARLAVGQSIGLRAVAAPVSAGTQAADPGTLLAALIGSDRLRRERPDGLIACMPQENIAGPAGTGSWPAPPRPVWSSPRTTTLSASGAGGRARYYRALPPLIGHIYRLRGCGGRRVDRASRTIWP